MTYIASSSKSDSFVWGSSGTHQEDETSNALMNPLHGSALLGEVERSTLQQAYGNSVLDIGTPRHLIRSPKLSTLNIRM